LFVIGKEENSAVSRGGSQLSAVGSQQKQYFTLDSQRKVLDLFTS